MDKEKLKSIFWDYGVNYTGKELYDFMMVEKEIKGLTRERVMTDDFTQAMQRVDYADDGNGPCITTDGRRGAGKAGRN